MSGATKPIEVMVDASLKKEIEENRKKLAPIVDTVVFCGRLGLPLRGHRDDAKYHLEVGNYSMGGVGNFVESLNFRVRAGDEVLEEHLKTCGKNQSYISKTSQNKIIKCCGQVISEAIIKDIKSSKFYCIIADEASDSSRKEQMSLVLRFVDSEMNIREEFIAFLHCKWGLSGAQLAKLILEALCDALAIVEVKNMMKHVNEISHFINISQTRNIPFEVSIKAHCSASDTKKTKLVDVCRTRWVERIEGMDTFQELFIPLYHVLEDMADNAEGNYNPSLSSDALSHFRHNSTFDFIVVFLITRHVLDVTLPVTQLLQGNSLDIMDGIHLITSLKDNMILMRDSVDTYHDAWYQEAVVLAGELDIEESKPRTVGRQTARGNHPFTSISEYYKRTITIPLIDHFNLSLQTRFVLDSVNVYKGLCIVPTKMISLISKEVDWKKEFKTVSVFYYDDLPNPLALDAELSLWETYWMTFEGLRPSNVASTLKAVSFDGFENINLKFYFKF